MVTVDLNPYKVVFLKQLNIWIIEWASVTLHITVPAAKQLLVQQIFNLV